MNQIDLASEETGAFIRGALDVVFAFSIALERRGLLTRAEIVETLREVQAQMAAQEGSRPGRTGVVELMRQAFALPVAGEQARSRFQVIEGSGNR